MDLWGNRFTPSGFLTTTGNYGTRTLDNGWGNFGGIFGDNYKNNFNTSSLATALGNNGLNIGQDLNDAGWLNFLQQQNQLSLNDKGNAVLGNAFQNQQAYDALKLQYQNGLKNGTISANGSTTLNGTDQFGNKTFMGGTGLQWAGFGANLGLGLWGAYQQHKQTKLAQQAFEEQKALQRANYKMQAKSFNNSLRNQQSGRGFVGMSGSAKRTLGREYDARKAEETY